MEKSTTKQNEAGTQCSCEICLLHPHLKGALHRMKPPELRLYSHSELLSLLECDISSAGEENKFRVGSDESWWHLCASDPMFPFCFIPTKEFVFSLASYLAYRVRGLRTEQRLLRGGSSTGCSTASSCSSSCSCCCRWDLAQCIRILECGAGTGLLAAHLVPLLQQRLQPNTQSHNSNSSHEHQEHPPEQGDTYNGSHEESDAGDDGNNKRLGACGVSSRDSLKVNDRGSQGGASVEESVAVSFTYVASEPRQELQWCPRGLSATRVGCRAVMKQLYPQLVICCWMPFNVDWTEAARANCCPCCKDILRKGNRSRSALKRRGCACQVQEYILVGHAEGGLVGRPLETWGLRCTHATQLPLGVDYEDPHGLQYTSVADSVKTRKKDSVRKKRRRSERSSESAPAQWRPANAFSSLPPECAAGAQYHGESTNVSREENSDNELEAPGEFGGMQLMPLKDRPYSRDGFVRLPPLPGRCGLGEKDRAPREDEDHLQELQSAQQLSRFDSLHSLRHGCPSVSRVVVFRRTKSLDSS